MLCHPNNFEFSHWSTALQFLQNRPSLACFHKEMDSFTPQDCAIQLCDVLVPEASLDLHIRWLKLIYWDLEHKNTSEILNNPKVILKIYNIGQCKNQKANKCPQEYSALCEMDCPGTVLFASDLPLTMLVRFQYKIQNKKIKNKIMSYYFHLEVRNPSNVFKL